MMKQPEAAEDESSLDIPRKINIVVNRFEDLKDRIPVDCRVGEAPDCP